MPDLRNPLSKARDLWFETDEGKRAAKPATTVLAAQFLKNRLDSAFIAGWDACVQQMSKVVADAALKAVVKATQKALLVAALAFLVGCRPDDGKAEDPAPAAPPAKTIKVTAYYHYSSPDNWYNCTMPEQVNFTTVPIWKFRTVRAFGGPTNQITIINPSVLVITEE